MESPILMSTGVISLAANQQQEITDVTRLQNPFRTPMLLDEVRFIMADFGQKNFLQAKFRLGRTSLTRDYTPIGNFCKNMRGNCSVLTWRLPKPLYIPANEYLVPHIRNTFTSTRSLEVIYAGRSLAADAPVPKSMFVPWVAAYQAPSVASTGATGTDTTVVSSEADIVNPLDETVYVQRFIGRYQSVDALGNSEPPAQYLDNTLIRAVNHEGTIMVKDSTPFGNLFDYTTKVWPAGTVLPPKGFFLFEIQRDFTGFTVSETTAPIISMVGYREVQLR